MSCSVSILKSDLFDNLIVDTTIPYKYYYRGKLLENYPSDIDNFRYALCSYLDYVDNYSSDSYFAPSVYTDKVSVIKKDGNDLEITYIDIVYEGDCLIDSTPYSVDCPFWYKLYTVYHELYNDIDYWIDIYKGDTLVKSDEIRGIDYYDSFAISYMQSYIDDCEANLRIKTDCCILACCEPDKYILI